MTNKELTDKLGKIGYTPLWLDYGVLTIDFLIEQEQSFDKGDDQNTEHYRYHAFRDYLNSKTNLDDLEFDNYLKLTLADTDPLMASSAAIDLFDKVDLTDFQFKKLCKTIGHFGKRTEQIVVRQSLLRQLRTSKLTNELFRDCIGSGDKVIHEYIVEIADSTQLQELAINGKNKKIRNIATEKLNRLIR